MAESGSVGLLHRLLAHPATRGLDLDSPETTAIRREIVRSKPFLRAIYNEWYDLIVERLPPVDGVVLELGAGGGFMDDRIPGLVTSDVFDVPGVQAVVDARELPYEAGELRAVVMTNVFHHIPNVGLFLSEAERCLVPGGRIIMIEPWNTGWSRFVHRWFHHEAMDPGATDWDFPATGPLSDANAALPWIVVERDRGVLEKQWPLLSVDEVIPFMPIRYLLSGGVSLRALQPGWSFSFWKSLENTGMWHQKSAVFALVAIDRRDRWSEQKGQDGGMW
jgi:SAM-dependent methyltransferase